MRNSANPTRGAALAAFVAVLALLAGHTAGAQNAAVTSGAARAVALSPAERRDADALSAESIRKATVDLSAPAMEGRATATAGGERAAKYIADRFAQLGLKPIGDKGTYFQAVPFRSTQLQPETAFAVGDAKLALGKEFLPAPPFPAEGADATGGLVFVGYGVSSADLGRDDYAGLDVKGKIAVVLSGRPDNVDQATWTRIASQQALVMALVTRGVAGVVIVGYGEGGEWTFDKLADYLMRRSVALAGGPAGPPIKLPPIALATSAAAEKMFAGSGATFADTKAKAKTGEFVSRDLGKTATLSVRVKREEVTGSNVVAVLEGSDPTLKSEAVLYTAHYDAFGTSVDGRVYAGAADNALGVAEILAIAEAFAKSPERPRRSIVFLAVTGEEHGLLGAKHYAEHPTWPLERVVANVNFDGIGTEVYGPVEQIVGFGAEYSTLGAVFEDVAAATGLRVVPDPMPEEKAFYRSDHYAFVKKGVPALMVLGAPGGDTALWVKRANEWLKTDYHQTTDVVRPDWNWSGARTIAVVGLLVGRRVAAADAMPTWLPTAPFNRPAPAAP